MELTNIPVVKQLCKKYDLHPNRSNSQNFLIDKNVLEKIVAAGELTKDDVVLEIGPGFGVLTQELVKHAGKVIAVEKDKRLAEFLTINNKQLTINNNLEVLNEDILKISNFQFPISNKMANGQWKIISNLPYQITAPVLWKFLEGENIINHPLRPPLAEREPLLQKEGTLTTMVLMVQKEVGERICARPGKMSILSVMCQFYADCKIVAYVGKDYFWPVPEVDSVIVKLVSKCQSFKVSEQGKINEKEFFRMVKIGFSAKRKMLKNNLAGGLQLPMEKVVAVLQKAGVDEKIRAQELAVKDWVNLYQEFGQV